jgi:outer membrane protein TolC
MKTLPAVVLSLLLINDLMAQSDSLTLHFCHESAISLSPLSRQRLLYQEKNELQNQALGKGNLPKIDVLGTASYQSEVFQIPGTGSFPDYPQIPKEQFRLYMDVKQKIYDGNLTKLSRSTIDAEYTAELHQMEIDLDRIKTTVNQLYFAALLSQESVEILNNIKQTLKAQRAMIESGVKNGTMLENSLLQIDKKILGLDQQLVEATHNKAAYTQMLGKWIGQEINTNDVLKLPILSIDPEGEMHRPELDLIHSKKEVIDNQSRLLQATRYPKFYAFGQGGIGQPNPFNFFEVDPSSYYILGVQLSWNIYDWGKNSLDRQSLEVQKEILNTKYEDIEHTLSISLIKLFLKETEFLQLLEKDGEIIRLQEKIVTASESQFNHGVIRSSEYLTEVNNLTDALLKQNLHKISLGQTRADILLLTGNL